MKQCLVLPGRHLRCTLAARDRKILRHFSREDFSTLKAIAVWSYYVFISVTTTIIKSSVDI